MVSIKIESLGRFHRPQTAHPCTISVPCFILIPMSSTLQFAIRSKEGIFLKEQSHSGTLTTLHSWTDPSLKLFRFTPDGKGIFIGMTDSLSLFSLPSLTDKQVKRLYRLELPFLQELIFSPNGTLMCTMQKPLPTSGTLTGVEKNIKVWKMMNGELIFESAGKSAVQFTESDIFVRYTSTDIIIHKGPLLERIQVDRIDTISVRGKYAAVFTKESAGKPATIRIFDLQTKVVKSQRTLFKVDRVDFKWSPNNDRVLVQTSTDVDRTNQSYYGEDHLHLMICAEGQSDSRVNLDKEGPIHDCTWHPKGTEFIVIYGFMPSKTSLFNSVGELVYIFEGLGPRNMVKYNHDGAAIAFGAFGNLPGNIDIWSRHRMARVGSIQASNSTIMEWSVPLGSLAKGSISAFNSINGHSQHILTATLNPRLRVDNGYRVWNWRGREVQKEAAAELYQVAWRPGYSCMPSPDGSIDTIMNWGKQGTGMDGHTSNDNTSTAPVAVVGAYRPPSLRGTPSSITRDSEGHLSTSPSTATPGNRNVITTTAEKKSHPPPPTAPSTISKEERALRRLREKLSQIEDLKIRARSGESLERNQMEKIAGEGTLREEIAMLERMSL